MGTRNPPAWGILVFGLFLLIQGSPLVAAGSATRHVAVGGGSVAEAALELASMAGTIDGGLSGTAGRVASATFGATDASQLLFGPEDLATSPLLLLHDPFSISVRLLTSLFLVICLILVLSWFLQKRSGLQQSVYGRVLGVLPLNPRGSVFLVDILGRVFALGVTDQQVSLLFEVTDKTTTDALRLQSPTSTVPGLDRMFAFLRRGRTAEEAPPVESDFAGYIEKARENIQQMDRIRVRREEPPAEAGRRPPPPPEPSGPPSGSPPSSPPPDRTKPLL